MSVLPKTVGEFEFFLEQGALPKPPQPQLQTLITASYQTKLLILEKALKKCEGTVEHQQTHLDQNKQVTVCFNPDCWKQQTTLKKCTQCKVAFYCSQQCQIAHWPVHKVVCQLPAAPAK